jgi:hypothetical protein
VKERDRLLNRMGNGRERERERERERKKKENIKKKDILRGGCRRKEKRVCVCV